MHCWHVGVSLPPWLAPVLAPELPRALLHLASLAVTVQAVLGALASLPMLLPVGIACLQAALSM